MKNSRFLTVHTFLCCEKVSTKICPAQKFDIFEIWTWKLLYVMPNFDWNELFIWNLNELMQVECKLLILLFSPLPCTLMLLLSTLLCLPLALPSWFLVWKILTNLTGVINQNIAIMFMGLGKYCPQGGSKCPKSYKEKLIKQIL